jgi:glycosyltransferase involved in cell wall biosynthesis
MKFTFITTMLGSPWGGSEELWSKVAIQLKNDGHSVSALVPHRPRLSEKVLGVARQGVEIRTYPAPSYLAGPARYSWDRLSLGSRRTYAWLKRFSPDLVVISQGEISGGLEWARICREAAIPYVIIVHCNSELLWYEESLVGDAVASYTTARKVFCVSHGNLNLIRLQVGEPLPNAEVLWNPYNVSTEPAPDWPDDNETWRLACVARLDPAAKGQDLLLQTLARPEWRERRVEVNLFGAGSYELTLRRMAAMLRVKNVHFRGHVSDIRNIWKQNHILLLPSRYEGLPLALVEAMWCGRPAVVTDVGGNAELCIDGETGFVAPSATLSSFSEALQRAWDARAKWPLLGRAARARAENKIPKDPIGLFSTELIACATAKFGSALGGIGEIVEAKKSFQ